MLPDPGAKKRFEEILNRKEELKESREERKEPVRSRADEPETLDLAGEIAS